MRHNCFEKVVPLPVKLLKVFLFCFYVKSSSVSKAEVDIKILILIIYVTFSHFRTWIHLLGKESISIRR